jgi:phosphoribosyl 1,2-cyclic phosphate phosphodiesterase
MNRKFNGEFVSFGKQKQQKFVKVLFLGTGPSLGVPIPTCECATCNSTDDRDKRLRSSVYINTGEKSFLIDCGPDFRQQALKFNLRRIDFILITHKHNDHIGGLDDVRPFNYSQNCEMKLFGNEESISDIKKRFYYSFDENRYPGAPKFELCSTEGKEDLEIEGLKIKIIYGMHGEMRVQGYRVGDFSYITDFKYIDDIELKKLLGTKVLTINALLPVKEHRLHFNMKDALEIAEKVNAEKVFLTHLSHWFKPHAEIILPQNVFMAYDGLEIEF